MTRMHCYRNTSALLICLLLSACGGGGGGGGGNPAPVQPANRAPIAAFTLDITSGTAPLVVTADASNTTDSDGQIVSYQWDFAGEPAIGAIAQYTFTQPGTYNIQLTVTDDDQANATTSASVTVRDASINAQLSGTVRILSSTAVDADVNDRLTLNQSNNTFDSAQNLPTPVILGGFANRPNTGPSTGNLFATGDRADFYIISLNGDELITLFIAEANADLDLRLWNEQRQIVDASLANAGENETLEVPQAGRYYIEVMPVAGASNYILTVGQNVTSNSQVRPPSRMTDPFVPGELIVKHKPKAPKADLDLRYMAPLYPEYSYRSHGPDLYRLNPQTSRSGYPQHPVLDIPAGGQINAEQQAKLATLAALKRTLADPQTDYAELNLIVRAHAEPNDTFYGSQWHYPAINLPTAWDTTTGSNQVIVAVVDTGVLVNHPDLSNKLVNGFDFISNDARSRDNEPGIDANPDDPGDLQYGGSSSFHGTHVAGTVGATTNNNSGVSGVAWQTRIMPMRALGKDGGSTFDILQAVRYAAGLDNTSGTTPANRADIINLSLGTSFSSQSEQDTYTEVIQAGVLVIASAGNDRSSLPSYPAAYDGVVGVSATTITNEIANYSNFGSDIDIAAPGGSNISDLNGDGINDGVISAMGDDSGARIEFGYAALSGTSMAAPHVAGVAALMKAVYPTLTPAEFYSALAAGELTDDLGTPGRDDQFGFGLINAQKAVVAAQQLASGQGADPGPILAASASTLNYGSFTESLELTLRNIGTGDLNITNVSTSEPWVGVRAPGTPDGLGAYTISINRNGLSDGAYDARVTFTSDANDIPVTLIMQVSQLNLSADAGLMYIILVDENGDTANQIQVNAVDGEYQYTLSGVAAGQYRLFAGTDADDDAKLCDAGESCGAYPTLDSPEFIAVNGPLLDLDFESGFRVNLSTDANVLGVAPTEADPPAQQTLELLIDKSTSGPAAP
jgi:serine protease